jgi:hypothetical protein
LVGGGGDVGTVLQQILSVVTNVAKAARWP